MATNEVRVPYKCGRDGTEWEAVLRAEGPKLRFGPFEKAGVVKEAEEDPRTRIARGWREAQEAFRINPPLPPPPQTEIVTRSVKGRLTDDQITPFGFQCPTCNDPNPLLCPAPECRKFSCRGGPKDLAGRMQCIWCGTTLVFVARTPGAPESPPIEIDATSTRQETRTRELPSGGNNEP